MSFLLENPFHSQVVVSVLASWITQYDQHDILLICNLGQRITTRQSFLSLHSPLIRTLLDNIPPSVDIPAISVNADIMDVSGLICLLTTGNTSSEYGTKLEEVEKAAESLGITLTNCEIVDKTSKRTPVVDFITPIKAVVKKIVMNTLSLEESVDQNCAATTTASLKRGRVGISPSDMGGQMDEIDIDDGSDHLIIGESALSFIPEASLSNEENIQEVSCNEDLPREIKAQYITKIQEEVYDQDENGIKSKKKYHYEYEKLSCDYDECNYKADIYSLKKHKEAVHMGIKYSCDLCNYQTAWPGSLRSHRIKLHRQPQCECNECGYQGTSKSDLSAHINKRHQSNLKCGDCEYVAKQPGNLRKHIRSIHSGVKYPCDDCDYEATQSNSLKLHIESVHKKIKYPCDLCHQMLSRKQLLKRHKLKMHSIS